MKIRDITGQKFNRLLPLERFSIGGHSVWKCQCDCGNITNVALGHIIDGHTKSCGCYNLDNITLPPEQAAFNQVYLQYKQKARDRNYSFELTKDEVRILTKQNCYYCGDKPLQVKKNIHNNGDYIYNGIDRLDNTKGYIIDNCVPCCGICNIMKRDMTVEEFYGQIDKIIRKRIME